MEFTMKYFENITDITDITHNTKPSHHGVHNEKV